MLTKDEMYDLYFNKGYVIAVRLDEFGAFVGDLIDRHQIIWHKEASDMYKTAKRIVEEDEDHDPVVYAVYCRDWLTSSTWLCNREAINEPREVILYSAQDTVKNIKLRISEQEQKTKDNNDKIKKYESEIKELNQKISELTSETVGSLYIDISCDEEALKKYGFNA